MSSTKGLEKKFDGTQVNLTHFLQQVQDRAGSFGWQSIMTIADVTGHRRSLTTEYGTLTQANVSAAANAYMATNTRERQASNCMQLFIKASIEPEVAIELTQLQDNYTVIVQNERRINGPLMLYQRIGMVAIETRATV
jgi:hypothetical protein